MENNNDLTNDLTNADVEGLREVNTSLLAENTLKNARNTVSSTDPRNAFVNLPLKGPRLTAPGAPQKLRASLSRLPGFIQKKLNKKMRKTRKARKARKTRRRESR
jgi:hypothetical protein